MCNTICGKFGSNLYRARVNSSLFKVRIYCYYHITGVLTLVILFFNCSYFYFLFSYQMSWVSEIKDTEHIWASSCICRLSGNLCLCLPYSLFLTFQGKLSDGIASNWDQWRLRSWIQSFKCVEFAK